MSDKQYFSGNNLRQAVLSAASQLGLEPDDVVYEEVKKKGGTLKGRRRVVIVVHGDGTAGSSKDVAPTAESATESATESPAKSPPESPPESPAGPVKAEAAGTEETPSRPVSVPGAVPVDAVQPKAVDSPPRPAPVDSEDDDPDDYDDEDDEDDLLDDDLSAPLFFDSDDDESDEADASDAPHAPRAAQAQAEPKKPASPQPSTAPAPAGEEATGRFAKAADQALIPLLAVAGLDIEAAIFQGEERLEIDLSGRDQDLLTAEKGELLQAVEHLMPRLIRGVAGETTAVRVDCDGFHAAREEELRQLALRLAKEVKASGTPHSTGPLEPGDRRIVHIAVEDDKEIVSRSDGRGFRKKVTLRLA